MPYGVVTARRVGRRIIIEVELPDRGEPSERGRAENLVDPRLWRDLEDENDHLGIKMTVCRPYSRQRVARSRVEQSR